jgi:drug/metabolite transporter (DMT)-like permease
MLIPFYGAFVLDNWSLQFISSSKSCLIYNLMPLISAIIAYFGFGKKITVFQWTILFFGFASLIPILEINFVSIDTINAFNITLLPELGLLASVALGAWGWLLIQQLLVNKNYNLLLVNGVGLFGAGLLSGLHLILLWVLKTMPMLLSGSLAGSCVFLISLWRNPEIKTKEKWGASLVDPSFVSGVWQPTENLEAWQPNPQDQLFSIISSVLPFNSSYWITLSFYVGWLIVACHLIGYTLYGYLLKQYSATFLAFAGTTIPLLASLLGYVFLNESVPKGFMLSFVLMTASLLLFYSQEKEG